MECSAPGLDSLELSLCRDIFILFAVQKKGRLDFAHQN